MENIDNTEAAERALTPVPASQLQNYRADIDMAQLMAKASVLPSHLHGSPGNCLAVITLAQSWGMNPIAVGLKTSVIPKRGGGETLMFEGQLVNAAINRSGILASRLRFDIQGEGQAMSCRVTGRIKGENEDREVTVGMPTIQNSPLWKGNQGEREQQLSYLAARVWARRHAPEIMLGVYTREDDMVDADLEPNTRQNTVAAVALQLESNTPAIDIQAQMPVDPFIQKAPMPVKKAEKQDAFGLPVCGTCGGRGIVETPEGKEPCQDCGGGK